MSYLFMKNVTRSIRECNGALRYGSKKIIRNKYIKQIFDRDARLTNIWESTKSQNK